MKTRVKKLAKELILAIYFLERKCFPVKKDMIIFESNVGRNYSGNPKSIYEEMVARGLDKKYKCCIILEDLQVNIPGEGKKIKRKGFYYFYIMAVAGIWVSDSRLPSYIVKRKGVHYIQTWHGTPLKKLALDMDEVSMSGEKSIEDYKEKFFQNAQTWDYLISQNHYSTEIFRKAFGFGKTMLEIGYPRNDVLIKGNEETNILEIKRKLGLPLDKKILLYAPTWRDDQFYGNGQYKFSTTIDFSMLKEALSENYVMIVKYHYLVKDNINWEEFKGFIYNFDSQYDISDLYLVSDMLITDYSSVMFDYSLLKRPMLFFAYDLEQYKNNLRGFYFDFIEEAPGPISLTTQELQKDIMEYQSTTYQEKYREFLMKYNHLDDGTASEKVVELIEEKIAERGGSR